MKREDIVRHALVGNEPVRLWVCVGPPKCDGPTKEPCPWCHVMLSDDMSAIDEFQPTEH